MSSTSKTSHGPPPTRHGIEYDEAISTLQKAIRRGDEELAIRTAVELDLSGCSNAAWRRLTIIALEDVGLGDPTVAVQISALRDLYDRLAAKKDDRSESWKLAYVQAVLVLSRARKSRVVVDAVCMAYIEAEPPTIPDYALDRHTRAGRKLGRSWDHFYEEGAKLENEAPIENPYAERARAAITAPKPRRVVARSQTSLLDPADDHTSIDAQDRDAVGRAGRTSGEVES